MKRFSLFSVIPFLLAAIILPIVAFVADVLRVVVSATPDLHLLGRQLRLVRSDRTKAKTPRPPFLRFEAEMTRMAAARGV